MSWQEEYIARYEARLREKWANNGKLIWRPGDTIPLKTSEVVIPNGAYVLAPELKGLKIAMLASNDDGNMPRNFKDQQDQL